MSVLHLEDFHQPGDPNWNAALGAALAQHPQKVLFPAGDLVFKRARLTEPGVILQGAGVGATVLHYDGVGNSSAAHCIFERVADNITIEGMSFAGEPDGTPYRHISTAHGQWSGFVLRDAVFALGSTHVNTGETSGVLIEHCTFRDFGEHGSGIAVLGGSGVIRNNHIDGGYTAEQESLNQGDGIKFALNHTRPLGEWLLEGNVIERCPRDGVDANIENNSGAGLTLKGNIFRDNAGNQVEIKHGTGGAGKVLHQVTILDNVFSYRGAVTLSRTLCNIQSDTSDGGYRGVRVQGNIFTGGGGYSANFYGIKLVDVSDVTVTGNVFSGVKTAVIGTKYCADVLVQHNTADSVGCFVHYSVHNTSEHADRWRVIHNSGVLSEAVVRFYGYKELRVSYNSFDLNADTPVYYVWLAKQEQPTSSAVADLTWTNNEVFLRNTTFRRWLAHSALEEGGTARRLLAFSLTTVPFDRQLRAKADAAKDIFTTCRCAKFLQTA